MENEPDPLVSAPRRVEAYLDQMLAPLTRRLSPFHRDELRSELREHLWARIEAYRKLNRSEDEAVTEALRQFGGAEDFLRQWRREWTKTPPRVTPREVWEAARPALCPSLTGLTTCVLSFFVFQRCPSWLLGSPAAALLNHYGTALFWAFTALAFVGLPTLVGAWQGHRRPERAGAGMLVALTTEVVVTGILYRFVAWDSPEADPTQSLFTTLFVALTAWILTAPGAAAVSGWWARRSQTHGLA